MYDSELGRLVKVDEKEKWRYEEKDFSPWLVENLDQLSSVLDIDLDFVGREVRVGPYRADVLARNSRNGDLIVIENQLTRADPKHLGQLLTYVARLKAHSGVWIAPYYWDTNLSAIRLLNKCGGWSPNFYAVKLSLFENGNSAQQAVLNVIEHPKKWQDPLAVEFWKCFASHLPHAPVPRFNPGSNLRRGRHYVSEVDLCVVQYIEANFVRVYVTGNGREPSSEVYERIRPYRRFLFDALEKADFLPGDNPRCTTELRVNSHGRHNWKLMANWLENQRVSYEMVLRECLKGTT